MAIRHPVPRPAARRPTAGIRSAHGQGGVAVAAPQGVVGHGNGVLSLPLPEGMRRLECEVVFFGTMKVLFGTAS